MARDESPAARDRTRIALGVAIVLATLVGLVLRIPLILGSQGSLNADEAVTGIMARHILDGDLYVTLPGQYYQGPMEAYVAAVLVPVLGATTATLKIVAMLWFAVAFAILDRAAVVLAGTRPWFTFALAWCSSSLVIWLSTMGFTGWGGALVFAAAALLCWAKAMRAPARYERWILLTGVCSGVAVWQQPTFLGLALSYVVLVWVVAAWPRLRATAWLALGGVLGVVPLIALNIRYAGAGLEPSPQPPTSFGHRLDLVLEGLLPREVGAMARVGDWIVPHALTLVLAVAALAAVGYLLSRDRPRRHSPFVIPLAMVPVTVLVVAYFPTTWWILDGRYATSLAIPFALLATLLVQRLTIPGRWAAVVPIVALAVVLAVSIRGLQIQDLLRRDVHQNDTAAIARVLEANGLRCVVGNYWAVEPFSYLGGDRFLAEADSPVRFPETRARITASPGRYAILQRADMPPDPLPAGFAPTPVRAGDTFVFLPAPRAAAVPGAPC